MFSWQRAAYTAPVMDELFSLVRRFPRLVVLTGAGVSAPSGIPTYRDEKGQWQHSDPIQHRQFLTEEASRRRYWSRSMTGWQFVKAARANPAHLALAELEQLGHVKLLVTQNVDRLHQQAGQRAVIDLHGRVDRVVCLDCSRPQSRADLQVQLEALNPEFRVSGKGALPDGDADVEHPSVSCLHVPVCPACGGILMPDVVFFGGTVPRKRIYRVSEAIERTDALMVAGSSLMVYSGFRFARLAIELGKPLIIVNRGLTRADEIANFKMDADCAEVLPVLAAELGAGQCHGSARNQRGEMASV